MIRILTALCKPAAVLCVLVLDAVEFPNVYNWETRRLVRTFVINGKNLENRIGSKCTL